MKQVDEGRVGARVTAWLSSWKTFRRILTTFTKLEKFVTFDITGQ
jgi:hypothetical protein